MTTSFTSTIEAAMEAEIDAKTKKLRQEVSSLQEENLSLQSQVLNLESRLEQITKVVVTATPKAAPKKRRKKSSSKQSKPSKAAQKLNSIMEAHDLTQAQMGKLIGVSSGCISNWTRGVFPIPTKRIPAITKIGKQRKSTILRHLNKETA